MFVCLFVCLLVFLFVFACLPAPLSAPLLACLSVCVLACLLVCLFLLFLCFFDCWFISRLVVPARKLFVFVSRFVFSCFVVPLFGSCSVSLFFAYAAACLTPLRVLGGPCACFPNPQLRTEGLRARPGFILSLIHFH